jgi:hypothetical protein
MGGYYADGAPGLDFLDKLSQAAGNTPAPDREGVRHACLREAATVLFSRCKVAYEEKREIMRDVASVAEFKESDFAEIEYFDSRSYALADSGDWHADWG